MTVQRLEHIGIVVDDSRRRDRVLRRTRARIGMPGSVEGGSVDRINGLEGPAGGSRDAADPGWQRQGRAAKYRSPSYEGVDGPVPANTPGIRHILFVVDDIEASLVGLRAHGGELVARG